MTEADMTELECLVLCKGELFYQTEDGRTLKTMYPCSEETAEREAQRLRVSWRKE